MLMEEGAVAFLDTAQAGHAVTLCDMHGVEDLRTDAVASSLLIEANAPSTTL